MKPIEPENSPKVPFDLDGRILHVSSGYEIVYLTLRPGEMIEKHNNPMDVFFFVLEGEGIFLGGETGISRKKGQGIHMEGGLPRSIENTGIAELRVLVLKDK